MSTRATYKFTENKWNNGKALVQTFYIHHDGYHEGAAFYFANMLQAKGRTLADRFIRGNEAAETTESHEVHGDTEHRYDVIKTYIDGKAAITVAAWDRKIDAEKWILQGTYDLAPLAGRRHFRRLVGS